MMSIGSPGIAAATTGSTATTSSSLHNEDFFQ